jgi:hypothetical protein
MLQYGESKKKFSYPLHANKQNPTKERKNNEPMIDYYVK